MANMRRERALRHSGLFLPRFYGPSFYKISI